MSWLYADLQSNGNNLYDVVGCITNQSLPNGTGVNQANSPYHIIDTLPSGGTVDIDLANLTFFIFNDSFNVSYSGGTIKCLMIRNTDPQGDIIVRCSGSEYFRDPFNNTNADYVLKPQAAFSPDNFIDGWAINGSNHLIRLVDQGFGATYELAIVGVSGVF